MRTASIVINAIIFIATCIIVLLYFRKDGVWDIENGLKQFRFFTVLSNCLSGIAALLMAIGQIRGDVSQFVFMMKYLGTVSVTLTFLTVLLFLGPTQGGYVKWFFDGDFFYTHLIGPLLALLSFCLLARRKMSFGSAMMGLLPMLLYGAVYLYKVMFAPENRRWEDFYGFNKAGKWPIACVGMVAGASLICVLFWRVCGM